MIDYRAMAAKCFDSIAFGPVECACFHFVVYLLEVDQSQAGADAMGF
jgi:hypothetical protein